MKSLLTVCAAAVLAWCAASTASEASTITTTWTGTIRDGNDAGGYFGGLASGTNFKITSVFNSANYSTPADPNIVDEFLGGSATLTVNGQNYLFNQSPASLLVNQYGELKLFIGDVANTFLSIKFYSGTSFTSVLNLPASQDCYDSANGYCGGSFEIVPGYSGAAINGAHLDVAETPIPATLPLLASALGGLGFAGWRRKKAAATA